GIYYSMAFSQKKHAGTAWLGPDQTRVKESIIAWLFHRKNMREQRGLVPTKRASRNLL
ncbi:MAG: hypothetical protein ACJA1A_002156, partial [Saprospiraceae bacterium]